MPDCIFCKIVDSSIPADKVAETENILAFRDIDPVAPTHVLLIPKSHVADSAAEVTAEHGDLLAELFGVAGRVASEEGLDNGWKLVTNVGAAAGQTVFHLHFHLIGGWNQPLSSPAADG